MKKTFLVLCVCLLLSALAFARDAEKSKVVRGAQVIKLLHHDVSAPFKDLPNIVNYSTVKRVYPIRPVPLPAGATDEANASRDPNVQTFVGAPAIPSTNINFEGIGEATNPSCNCAPPDTNGAVGPNHFVQTVNTTLGIYNKNGTQAAAPKTIQSLWSGFAGQCANTNDGDPVVAYDQFADRWVISQFSVTGSNRECIAVSTTNNPTGSYYRYEYQYTGFNDYPKIAVWSDGYYITYNMFSGESGAKVCAFDRSKMLTGAAAGTQCFNNSTYSLLAATIDGPTLPPAGAPEYLVNYGTNSLRLWKFKVDWANSANSTFTGPTTINTNAFTVACNGGSCIPQSGTQNKLDSLADRLMNRFAYRNFGTHESFVVNHSVLVNKAKGKEVDGVRWYELRNTPASSTGTPSMFQQGTYAPNDGLSRWMGSISMDKQGNIGLGFSASGPSAFPSIRYTGRLAGDPAGQMSQGEAVITTGTGSQTGSLHRWGDYSSIMADPVDGCTFWYTTEYLTTNGSFNWHTRIGAFKVNSGCN